MVLEFVAIAVEADDSLDLLACGRVAGELDTGVRPRLEKIVQPAATSQLRQNNRIGADLRTFVVCRLRYQAGWVARWSTRWLTMCCTSGCTPVIVSDHIACRKKSPTKYRPGVLVTMPRWWMGRP